MNCPASTSDMPVKKKKEEEEVETAMASLTIEEVPAFEIEDEEEKEETFDLDFCRVLLLYNVTPMATNGKGEDRKTHTYMIEFFNRFHYSAADILRNPGVLKNLGGQAISDDPTVPVSEQRFVQPMSTFLDSPDSDHKDQVKQMLERNAEIHSALSQLEVVEEDHRVDLAPFSAVPYIRSLDVISQDLDEETGEAAWYSVIHLKNGKTSKLRHPKRGRRTTIDAPWIYGEWWTEVGQNICEPKPAADDVLARFREIPKHVAWFLPNTLLVDAMTLRLFDRRFIKALFINEDPSRPWLVRSIRVFVDEENLRPYMEFVKEVQQPLFDATKKHCDEMFGVQRKLAAILEACPAKSSS